MTSEAPSETGSATADLHVVVDMALARGQTLLTAGERVVVQRLRGLRGEAGELYARLSSRVTTVWEVSTLPWPDAVEELIELGLLSELVSWSQRAQTLTVPQLKQACRALGLRRGGRRDELVGRLAGHTHFCEGRYVRLCHRQLVTTLEQWAMLRRRPDRSAFVVERLGVVRWPQYALSTSGTLFVDRRAWLCWQERAARLDTADVPTCKAWLAEGVATGALSLKRSLCRRLLVAARQLERDGEPLDAEAVYGWLVDGGHLGAARIATRRALALEAAAQPQAALAVLQAALVGASRAQAVGIQRTGRRLARSLRQGWPPLPPLRMPSERTMALLASAGPPGRPRWQSRQGPVFVEQAVVDALAALGRRALIAEAPLWRTLCALLFAHAYFLPVPKMLPTRFLTGPLDLGSPRFTASRPEVVARRLAAIEAGRAASLVAAAYDEWQGTALAWAHWSVATRAELVALADAVPGRALAAMMATLLDGGSLAARGLPDLVVLPGPAVRMSAFPSRLAAQLLLVEVKGPSDTLSDEQRVWLDQLAQLGVQAEVWHVQTADSC